jgi:hypothetical protein
MFLAVRPSISGRSPRNQHGAPARCLGRNAFGNAIEDTERSGSRGRKLAYVSRSRLRCRARALRIGLDSKWRGIAVRASRRLRLYTRRSRRSLGGSRRGRRDLTGGPVATGLQSMPYRQPAARPCCPECRGRGRRERRCQRRSARPSVGAAHCAISNASPPRAGKERKSSRAARASEATWRSKMSARC